MNRRKFLIQCSGTFLKASTINSLFFSGGILIANPISANKKQLSESFSEQTILFSRAQWQTLTAIQEHLFPAKNGAPGASQFNAKAWLYNFLTFPEINSEVVQIYRSQIDKVNLLAKQQFKQKFIQLDESQKEQILRSIEKNRQSQRWLGEILNNIIEALLTDPVYGANNDAIGWKWLGHSPGFPRPNTQQKYFLLK